MEGYVIIFHDVTFAKNMLVILLSFYLNKNLYLENEISIEMFFDIMAKL